MTALAVVERERDLAVARPAKPAFDIGKHRVVDRAFWGSWEYVGVAEFTAVPDGVFLVRETNRMNS